jgi:hypothetical protein
MGRKPHVAFTMTLGDQALIGVSDASNDAPAPLGVALAGRALLGAVLGVALGAALGLVATEGSYAGVRDDVAFEQAASAHGAYLDALVRSLICIGLIEALLLAPVVLGLLLLLRARSLHARAVAAHPLAPPLLGLLAAFACFVGVAHRYPGLFLPLLASSRWLTAAVGWGHGGAALVFGAAGLGYWLTARDSLDRRVRFGCIATLLLSIVAWFGAPFLPGPVQVFRNSPLAPPPRLEPSSAPTIAAKARPNVLVLAVDSLRPDMIDPVHTPHLSRLLEGSIYFPNTLVTQPRTGPSWAAALTSLPPLRNGIETMFPRLDQGQLRHLALPAHLAALGYRTAVFSEYAGEFFARAELGFQVSAVPEVELRELAGQMLLMRVPVLLAAASLAYTQGPLGRAALGDRLTHLLRGMSNFASPRVLEDDMIALAALDRDARGGGSAPPFFWLAFYSQPHFPYTSSSDFYPEYEVPGSSPELRFGRDVVSERPLASAQDHRQLIGLYRAALAETDAAIGQLLARLDGLGLLDRTVVVLLADHGEGLYDCPTCVGHGDNLTSLVTLRVPLAFRLPPRHFPAASPSRHEGYVSHLDLYPTIARLLGLEALAHHEGLALLDTDGSIRPLPPRDHFAESGEWLWPTPAVPVDRIRYPPITQLARAVRGRIAIDAKYEPEIRAGKQRAVLRPPFKLNYQPGATDVQYHLYQFERDPFESQDLAARHPELVTELKRALFRSMLRHPQILPMGDYFLSRPEPPPPEKY